MEIVKVLLKKEFSERFNSLKNKRKDIAGIIFNALLIFAVVGVFAAVFMYLTKTYANVKIGYITKTKDRIFEIYTIFYLIITLLLVAIGIAKLNKNLISSGNLSLLHMPITPFQIFVSKLLLVYIELALVSVVLCVPVAILFAIQSYIAWWAVIVSFVLGLLLPFVGLGIASVFTLPYYFVKKWLNKQFVIQLIVYIGIVMLAFFLYSLFLKLVQNLMETGQIAFFFNEKFVNNLQKLCGSAYPINIFAEIMIGKNVVFNLMFAIISSAIFGGVCFAISKFVFYLVRQNKLQDKNSFEIVKKVRKPRSVVGTLMGKEFTTVLRTPSYAFSYYAIVLSLPLMVVITTNLLFSMMKNLTMFTCDFEIVLCAMVMYSILLNSFCASNFSRDGKFYNLLKTYPIQPKQIVLSKILFCSITSFISIVATGIIVFANGNLSILKTLAVVVICLILNFGIICLATRKDLNTINRNKGVENSQSTNFIVFWGLLISIALSVLAFVISILLQFKYTLLIANTITCAILIIISGIMCICSLIYLMRNLNKRYKEASL